ncbi:Transcriptional regulatory protein YycF [Pantoea agglomerans]|uniref:Transcriptional regulatory protein YycF n=1 Tax=Enterobacter agglomerans TaxID=549 RepID=A0A379AG46_ENTAG|nr:Transcriptional regulatory protein YycF [Pantoea agglomerans]
MKPAILVVDDDPAVCDVLQDALSEHLLTVYRCHQGREALSMLGEHPEISLVMLDMMLPDTNGLTGVAAASASATRSAGDYADRYGVLKRRWWWALRWAQMTTSPNPLIHAWWWREPGRPCAAADALPRQTLNRRAGVFGGWQLDDGRCQLFNPQRELVPLTQGGI